MGKTHLRRTSLMANARKENDFGAYVKRCDDSKRS